LKSVFLFTGMRTEPTIQGFSYKDHSSYASQSIFRADPHMKKITLRDVNIDIAYYPNSACRVFDDPSKWSVTGRYSSRTDHEWNGAGSFTGELQIGSDVKFAGNVDLKIAAGAALNRPIMLAEIDTGRLYFDKSLNKIVVWSGTEWRDGNGEKV
jgi:hypothetical protein